MEEFMKEIAAVATIHISRAVGQGKWGLAAAIEGWRDFLTLSYHGHTGFYASFEFDADGNIIEHYIGT